MTTTNHTAIQVGDWIIGTSHLDEKFIGYVDSRTEDNIVKIWVSQSDNDNIVGEFVQTKLSRIKKLPENPSYTQEELISLMDLALVTKDKEWFQDLISESYLSTNPLTGWTSEAGSGNNHTFSMKWRSRANERNL